MSNPPLYCQSGNPPPEGAKVATPARDIELAKPIQTENYGSPVDLRIGQQVRDLRKRAGLPLDALAARIGFSGPYLANLELGKRAWKIQHLAAVAEALGVAIGDLLPPELRARDGAPAPAPLRSQTTDREILDRLLSLSTRQADELKALALELAGRTPAAPEGEDR